ncbi:MAG TPA: Hpt domain-containing protein [Leptospiraceae bacterium]|nr:Hpt domain-containing protein [Leptospiraceae bacterium]HMW04598.1 Hpt domain-containing protein [Leptospiraceae bacterium]HMX34202.1 Hpt domain-containing protein [Leptospiraceae bacterium]HMY30435.1 Hpt domain-containing protein [Leptospiraceae bacterium]HMZ66402.1 Hpt domain-containing protein [Leptospiraceae bacterium]
MILLFSSLSKVGSMTDANNEIIVEVTKDFEDLVPEYIDSMNQSLGLLESLLENRNFEELKKEAHKMKGHGGAYGFTYISDMGRLIESFAEEEKGELIRKCLKELRTYMGRIKIEFKE